MVFSSMVFLCVFLPVVFGLHLVLPGMRAKNILLVIASLVFYAYGEPTYVIVLILSAFGNYLFARLIAALPKNKKWIMTAAVILNIGLLIFFKYLGFLADSLYAVTGLSISVPDVKMPIGISFFTFQALSYVIDVYRGTVEAQKNYGKVLLYISYFPQLIAGPIVKYHDVELEINNRKQTVDETGKGIRRFVAGLSKKVLIANTMGMAADNIFNASAGMLSGAGAWLGAVSYMLQIYFDFSGYSDMALGLGRMFGFHFKENFDYPYVSSSIREFWRRWHISLSGWFREYLYIPLGGNRKGKFRTVVNKMIVFLVTGIWHGASELSVLGSLSWILSDAGRIYTGNSEEGRTTEELFPARLCASCCMYRFCVLQGRHYDTGRDACQKNVYGISYERRCDESCDAAADTCLYPDFCMRTDRMYTGT